jgi:hypothetical protein
MKPARTRTRTRTRTRMRLGAALLLVLVLAAAALAVRQRLAEPATCCGWTKYAHNPVLGPGEGVIFDVTLLRDGGDYGMWNSLLAHQREHRLRHQRRWHPLGEAAHADRPTPIFVPDPSHAWEQAKVTAAQVFRRGDW